MRPRQDSIELFSTFVQFERDRFHTWITDPPLRRRMQQQIRALNSQPEQFWVIFWHQQRETAVARAHLAAYLQEPCYWAAQKTATSFATVQYTLADFFQIAIASLDKVLKNYCPGQGSLKNYASAAFASLIRERLRQRQEIDICTDWGLLRKLSQKRLAEALAQIGLPKSTIDRYILAWQCFGLCYHPTQATATRKLPPPDRDTWAAIGALYNQERHGSAADTATPTQLERWLLACAEAARAYLYPQTQSLNAQKSSQDAEFLDDLPADISLMDALILAEEVQARSLQQAEVTTLLTEAIARLGTEAIAILEMYYRHEMTQQQMAAQLDIKQYTVSRRLSKAREALLLAIAQWSQATLHTAPTSDVLKCTSLVLEEWLHHHYRSISTCSPTPAE